WRPQDSTTASWTRSWASASQRACWRAKSSKRGACSANHASQSDFGELSFSEPLFTRFQLLSVTTHAFCLSNLSVFCSLFSDPGIAPQASWLFQSISGQLD